MNLRKPPAMFYAPLRGAVPDVERLTVDNSGPPPSYYRRYDEPAIHRVPRRQARPALLRRQAS